MNDWWYWGPLERCSIASLFPNHCWRWCYIGHNFHCFGRRYCLEESQGELWIALKSWYVLPLFWVLCNRHNIASFPPNHCSWRRCIGQNFYCFASILFRTITTWTIDKSWLFCSSLGRCSIAPFTPPTNSDENVPFASIFIASRRYCSKQSQGEQLMVLRWCLVLIILLFSASVAFLPHYPPITTHDEHTLGTIFIPQWKKLLNDWWCWDNGKSSYFFLTTSWSLQFQSTTKTNLSPSTPSCFNFQIYTSWKCRLGHSFFSKIYMLCYRLRINHLRLCPVRKQWHVTTPTKSSVSVSYVWVMKSIWFHFAFFYYSANLPRKSWYFSKSWYISFFDRLIDKSLRPIWCLVSKSLLWICNTSHHFRWRSHYVTNDFTLWTIVRSIFFLILLNFFFNVLWYNIVNWILPQEQFLFCPTFIMVWQLSWQMLGLSDGVCLCIDYVFDNNKKYTFATNNATLSMLIEKTHRK